MSECYILACCLPISFAIMSGERQIFHSSFDYREGISLSCIVPAGLSLPFTINVIIKSNHKYFFYSAVYQFKSIHVGRDQNRVCKGVGLQGTSLKIHQDQRQNKIKRAPVPQGFQHRDQHFCQTSGKWKAWFSRLHSKIHWTKRSFPLGRWTQRRRIK